MNDEVVWTEVDGVPTVIGQGRGSRVKAGLVFRVGQADETLATTGITHLVEHLALHQQGIGDYHFNGATAQNYTQFHVEGTTEHVVEYFASVCAGLRDLPFHRLETEKEILRTERTGRGSGPASQLPIFRYGAEGYGLSSYHELGLPTLTPDRVADWARTRFTRDNAVLWVIGDEIPSGLRLDLPRGTRQPLPVVTSALPHTPAWFPAPGEVLCLHALVQRSTAAMVFARILGKALFADLRQRGGYSYTAQADYQVLDRDLAAVLAVADSAPDKQEAVVGGFVDVLARLRHRPVDAADLASATAAMRHDLEELDESQLVPGYAVNHLLGRPQESREQMLAELDRVSVDDLAEVANEVYASALVQVPALGLGWAGIQQAPAWSNGPVWGTEYPPLGDDAGTLVVGSEGVSLRVGSESVTVRYSDCVAVQAFPDGGRRIFGRDGFSIPVEPTMHRLAPGVTTSIVDSVPPSLVIPMPPRTPDQVPRPAVPEGAAGPGVAHPGRRPPGPVRTGLRRAAYLLMWPVCAFFLLMAVAATGAYIDDDPDMPLGAAIFVWAMFAVPAVATWKLRVPKRQPAFTPR